MKTRTLYLVRHGQRLDAVNKNWHRAGDNQYDPPLSELGFQQADRLAECLAQQPIDHLFVSPYTRALQTAQPVARMLALPLYVESGIGEWLGKALVPHDPMVLPYDDLQFDFPQISPAHVSQVFPLYPETAEQCFDRLRRTVDKLLTLYAGNLLLVGHGRTVTGIAHVLTGQRESNFRYEPACITQLDQVDGAWTVSLNGDTAHLTAQQLPLYV